MVVAHNVGSTILMPVSSDFIFEPLFSNNNSYANHNA